MSDINGSPDSFREQCAKMIRFFVNALVIFHDSSLPANFHSKKTQKLSLFVIHVDVPQKNGDKLVAMENMDAFSIAYSRVD